MARFDARAVMATKRLTSARMKMVETYPFYALLLFHIKFALDDTCETAYTDGERIAFNVDFLDSLDENELVFVLMHEILHVALCHCFRIPEDDGFDPHLFNVACDIVVNSNILYSTGMNKASITLRKWGDSMHKAPDGTEGYEFTAEEVYKMLLEKQKKHRAISGRNNANGFDNHDFWQGDDEENKLKSEWQEKVLKAAELAEKMGCSGCGPTPLGAERLVGELKNPQTDWREMLQNFIQEDITDYSFSPPDKRFSDSPFFLPDFNEKEDTVRDILFMIDASGSMSEDDLTAAYSEVRGAFAQFSSSISGWLGFFDATVVVKPFDDEEEFKMIHPIGGGGTSFEAIFQYVKDNMERRPQSIIVLTDGYAPFPKEEATMGIPVLWIINNTDVTPPWGRVARIK